MGGGEWYERGGRQVDYGQDGEDGNDSRRDSDASLAFALGLSRLVYPSRASHTHAHTTCPATGPRSVNRRAQEGVSEGAASEVGGGRVEVCTMVRDEEEVVVEFVEYHLLIGVAHVHVYLHQSADGTAQRLQPYVLQVIHKYNCIFIQKIIGLHQNIYVYYPY